MIQNTIKASFIFLAIFFLFSCTSKIENTDYLVDELEAIKKEFAPDKRVALLEIDVEKIDTTYVLKGESNLPHAVEVFKNNLNKANISFIDSIELLPSSALNNNILGLVTISVANLRSNPKHSAELATQATLGTPVKIYKNDGSWSLIQTPDNYLSWVDNAGIVPMTPDDFENWKGRPKIIYTNIFGSTYSAPDTSSQVVSDIVAGGILILVSEESDFYKAEYPDGRMAYINKAEAEVYELWLSETNPSEENLVATSKQLMGLPYLWGGTSTKGVDCSGYTKTIYFLNGIILPRDASQQIHTGELIDESEDFKNLKPGDLLFFGKKETDTSAERVIHVGMWIGNNEFIHSSGQVRVSSVDKNAANFDAYNLNRYLRTKRVVNSTTGAFINLTKTPVFTN
ncbi:SH3 domain-containing C40 family peptidase [Cellulophaga sp. Hel_I_12]|uniref:C40 family peptidase n=1 Tax=Cellulophaga sp. Hel_I_12 TaxID=1249972 RepID=UPI000646E445|nr:SH3 domain-containing C40 family peptidase [Cellulophaga sp. Hel_I_12]